MWRVYCSNYYFLKSLIARYRFDPHERGSRERCIPYIEFTPLYHLILQLLYYRTSPGILYQFTIPKHMTKAAMEAIIPRLKVGNQFNPAVDQPLADGSMQSAYETGYENIPTGEGSYPFPKDYRPRIIPNRRTSVQSPPQYIPYSGVKPELQSLTLSGRGQSRNLTESQQRQYSAYYGPFKPNQAVSGDYGRRYATLSSDTARNNAINQGYPVQNNNVINNRPPVLAARNIPDASRYDWRIVGFTECSLTCGRGKKAQLAGISIQ